MLVNVAIVNTNDSRLLFCMNKLGTAQWAIIVIIQPSHDTLIMEDVVAVILLGPTLG